MHSLLRSYTPTNVKRQTPKMFHNAPGSTSTDPRPFAGVLVVLVAMAAVTVTQSDGVGAEVASKRLMNSTATRGLLAPEPGRDWQPDGAKLWPSGIVVWRFGDKRLTLQQRDLIRVAMNTIQVGTKSCIRFWEDRAQRRKNGTIVYKAYRDNGEKSCESSSLGYKADGLQEIVLSPDNCEYINGNYAGSAVHEIFHALGFIHEFQRADRVKYFKFVNSTGKYGCSGTLDTCYTALKSNTFNITMNYESITNYDLSALVQETPNHPKVYGSPKNLGQECKLSVGDLEMVEAAYYKECRPDGKPKGYSRPVRIPTTDCGEKLPPMGTDVDTADEEDQLA